MCTETLYHADPKSKALGKKNTQIRGKVYTGSKMAQPRELREKIRVDGGTIQRKIKKHGRQEQRYKNTRRYWTHVELKVKCSRRVF